MTQGDDGPTVLVRAQVLRDAERLVTQDRNGEYGEPEDVFAVIAELWSAYAQSVIYKPHDVAIMLALLKVARLRGNVRHMDSWTDLAGYAALGAEMAGA